jgi:hypothetical protein
LRRLQLALTAETLGREELATVVADCLAALPDGARHAAALHLFETEAGGRLNAVVLDEAASLYREVACGQEVMETVRPGSARHQTWKRIEALLAGLDPRSVEAQRTANLLTSLFATGRIDGEKVVERVAERAGRVGGRCGMSPVPSAALAASGRPADAPHRRAGLLHNSGGCPTARIVWRGFDHEPGGSVDAIRSARHAAGSWLVLQARLVGRRETTRRDWNSAAALLAVLGPGHGLDEAAAELELRVRRRSGPAPSGSAGSGAAFASGPGPLGRIGVLQRCHGLDRCRDHGEDGMGRWIGWGIVAGHLERIVRTVAARQSPQAA